MTDPNTPNDGDFATYLEGKQKSSRVSTVKDAAPNAEAPRQTIQQVLVDGEEPTEEFLEEWNALENSPELSDEELEQQALSAPGDDGDTRTPE